MPASYRIISIGTLSSNPLWNDPKDARTGHATTTLISSGDMHVLVDPSLPPAALNARLSERTNVPMEQITHVFLTSLDSDRRRMLGAFPDAMWMTHAPERQAMLAYLEDRAEQAEDVDDDEVTEILERQAALVGQVNAIDDSIGSGIDIFPLPGYTAGTCGVLLPLPSLTILITGDAIATKEHLDRGQVLPGCVDIERAQESFKEAVEIADIIVPGRDNVILNPVRRMM